MDAGPIIAQSKLQINENSTATEMLNVLFMMGAQLLIKNMPSILSGIILPTFEIYTEMLCNFAYEFGFWLY